MKREISAVALLLFISLAFFRLPVCMADVTVTWFFRTDYLLKTKNTNVVTIISVERESATQYYTGYLGVRVYVNETEITKDVSAVVSRSYAGSGWQTASLPISYSMLFGSNIVKVKIYMKLGEEDWIEKAEFVSDQLFYASINGVWTFRFYTSLSITYFEGIYTTTLRFYFGSSSYPSRIEGISLKEPTIYDWMFYNLRTGNFIGFIATPYVNLVGSLFYGLMVLLFCMPLYIRYRNITVILFVMVLLGGAGGMVSLLIPESGLGLAWLIFVLGLAGLLYKVFR